MNGPLMAGGIIGTVLVLLFIGAAAMGGIRYALTYLAFLLGGLVIAMAIIAFWVWVAGGFA